MTSTADFQIIQLRQLVALGLLALLLSACGSGFLPLDGREDVPQPTFVFVEVTPPSELVSATATPWPLIGEDGTRMIPDGIDPELFSSAPPQEVIDLWTELLSGSKVRASSNPLYFRGQGRFEGELHLCPGGSGYFDGDPEGSVNWGIGASVGPWYEVALTHDVPGRAEGVSFVLSIRNGLPVRSDATEPLEFTRSDYCSNTDPGIERPSFTADERRLAERTELTINNIEEIPWINGGRQLPIQLTAKSREELTAEMSSGYWNAFLAGGVIDAVAYDYGTFVLSEAFSGSLHMCEGRIAVLEGEPSGIGEWAVQSPGFGSGSSGAKIVFTLPGDRTFRTLSLRVSEDGPVMMGRDEESGFITPSPLELRESEKCE